MTLGRMIAGIAAAWLLVATTVGCNREKQGDASKDQLVVGFSQVGAESSWRTAETKSIKDEAAKRGVQLKFSDAQGDPAKQVAAIRSFVTQGVDSIVLAPKEETGWEDVLREAKQAKIPVVLVDRGVSVDDDSLYVTLIAADFVEEGRLAAEWLAKKMNGKAAIVELKGTTGSSPANDRNRGFVEELKKHPDMKIVVSQTADFERTKGKEVMESVIRSGVTFDAVYAHNDDMALGAIGALKESGRRPGQDVILISIDGVRGAFEAMVAGELNATVECNPLLGPMLFDTIEKLKRGESVPKFIEVPSPIYEQSKAAELIHSRAY